MSEVSDIQLEMNRCFFVFVFLFRVGNGYVCVDRVLLRRGENG